MARLFAAIQMCEEVWLGVDIWTVGGMSSLCLPGDEQPVFTWGWAACVYLGMSTCDPY